LLEVVVQGYFFIGTEKNSTLVAASDKIRIF